MEINGPSPNIIKPTPLPSAISNWQVGQVLQATVVKQASPQNLVIQIGNQQLQADSTVNLPIGQKLELRVSQLGVKPILQARILSPTPPTLNTSQITATTQPNRPVATDVAINNILKQALPKQTSMATLLANLAWLNQPASNTLPIPVIILDIAKQLINQLPSKQQFSNSGQLKQNILNSGIFLESKLKQLSSDKTAQALHIGNATRPTNKPPTDLKLSLLRLLGAIQQITRAADTTTLKNPLNLASPQPLPFTPPPLRGSTPQPQSQANANLAGLTNLPLLLLELGKQVESSLARTQLHQAASLPSSEQSPTNLAFELPIRNNGQIDIFDIVINEQDKENQDEKDGKDQWGISLAFDLKGLGPVHAKLRMIDNKISTTFWAENAETTQLFNQNLENLRQRYHQAGLESSELCCYPGTPPAATTSRLPHIVLDIKV